MRGECDGGEVTREERVTLILIVKLVSELQLQTVSVGTNKVNNSNYQHHNKVYYMHTVLCKLIVNLNVTRSKVNINHAYFLKYYNNIIILLVMLSIRIMCQVFFTLKF